MLSAIDEIGNSEYGIYFTGLPEFQISELKLFFSNLEKKYDEKINISLINISEKKEIKDWFNEEKYSNINLNFTPTKAIQVRNDPLDEGLKLAFIWSTKEERLHSIFNRGYKNIGNSEVAKKVCEQGKKDAINEQHRYLWEALKDENSQPYFNLNEIIKFYNNIPNKDEKNIDPSLPRKKLHILGLLKDKRLLSDDFSTIDKIKERLAQNSMMVEKINRFEKKERNTVVEVLKMIEESDISKDNKDNYKKSYKALLNLNKNNIKYLEKLELEDARILMKEKTPEFLKNNKSNNKSNNRSNNRTKYKNLGGVTEGVSDLILEGENELANSFINKIDSKLKEDKITKDDIKIKDKKIKYKPNSTASLISKEIIGENKFGATLEISDDINRVFQDFGHYSEELNIQDDIFINKIRDLLEKSENFIENFEGLKLFNEFIEKRRELLSEKNLLSTFPLALLLNNEKAFENVEKYINDYRRLVSHLNKFYSKINDLSSDGAKTLYENIFCLDMFRIENDKGDMSALLSCTHPLVLWKYLELSKLILDSNRKFNKFDKLLLKDELKNITEPLLTIFAPNIEFNDREKLGYTKKIGSFPIYNELKKERANISKKTLKRTSEKLAVLYPPIKNNLRLLIVNPVTLEELTNVIKHLIKNKNFKKITIIIVNVDENKKMYNYSNFLDDKLDEYASENKLEIQRKFFESINSLKDYLIKNPVHILGVSGKKNRNVKEIEKEGTKLHPLSVPNKLEADNMLDKVDLRPRSMQQINNENGENINHPYGLYYDLISKVTGNFTYDLTVKEKIDDEFIDYKTIIPYTQFFIYSGNILYENIKDKNILRLTQDIDTRGDLVLTSFKDRIISDIKKLLKRMNYSPQKRGIENLLETLNKLKGEGFFTAIDDSKKSGFSQSTLKGMLAVAVVVNWYKENLDDNKYIILSLDSNLAKHWLKSLEDKKRSDLLVFRKDKNNKYYIDIVEIKSYKSLNKNNPEKSKPFMQLENIEKLLKKIISKKGDLLLDKRRELIRKQIYKEGINLNDFDREWVPELNKIIDGDYSVNINKNLFQIMFDKNIKYKREKKGGVITHNIGERYIQYYLSDVIKTDKKFIEEEKKKNKIKEKENSKKEKIKSKKKYDIADKDFSEEEINKNKILFELDNSEVKYVKDMSKKIYRILQDIGVKVKNKVDPEKADIGPSIIRFKVKLQTGEKLNNLQKRTKDLMRELAIKEKPIIGNIPGTNFIHIDIPRKNSQVVYYRDILDKLNNSSDSSIKKIECPIGVKPNGSVKWLDISKLPHMLVAGTTGSGKTVFLYNLILSLIIQYSKEDIELVLVDPKKTDFVFFNNVSHLRNNEVIIDPEEANEVIKDLMTNELERRTEILREAQKKDISSYNQSYPNNPIPPIIVFIDEFADLVEVMDKKEREEYNSNLKRLAQRARNVGIHLILATQRPTVDILKGNIKTNLPCRVSFRLSSAVDSNTILHEKGAENLIGKGDMLLKWKEIERLQGFYVSEDDLEKLLQ